MIRADSDMIDRSFAGPCGQYDAMIVSVHGADVVRLAKGADGCQLVAALDLAFFSGVCDPMGLYPAVDVETGRAR